MLHHILPDRICDSQPFLREANLAKQSGDTLSTIHCHPAHHLREYKMLLRSADLPDPFVRLLPLLNHSAHDISHHSKHIFNLIQRAREIEVILIDHIHEIAIRVILPLHIRLITHPYRTRILKPAEMIQFALY